MTSTKNQFVQNKSTSEFFPPTHLVSDYIQITYLIVVFCVGTPLNVYTFVKLSRQYYAAKSRMLLLSLHLNVSDLMILVFYSFAKICWLVTYKWVAGVVMCKIVRFTHALSVILSGNVVVCIGLDRLLSVLYPLQIKPKANTRCKQMLAVAWMMAVICSVPQLHVWTVYEVAPDWHQCTDIWRVQQELNATTAESTSMRAGYQIFHLIFLFWLPFLILLLVYIIILKKVYKTLGEEQLKFATTLSAKSSDSSNVDLTTNQKRNWTSVPNLTKAVARLQWTGSTGSLKTMSRSSNNLHHSLLRRNVSNLRVKRTKHRTLKVSIVIVLAYIVCWLPYNCLEIWNIVHPKSYAKFDDYVYFFYGLIVLNAMINPLIYSRLSFTLCRQLERPENNNGHVKFALKER